MHLQQKDYAVLKAKHIRWKCSA